MLVNLIDFLNYTSGTNFGEYYIASILIFVLLENCNSNLNKSFLYPLSGGFIGYGLMAIVNELFSRKKRSTTETVVSNPKDKKNEG